MKKTATITFHAAHNYGSNLQAYALQQTILSLGHSNEIINLRTDRQKDLYTVFTKRKGLKYVIKNLSHLFYYFPLILYIYPYSFVPVLLCYLILGPKFYQLNYQSHV